MTSVSDIVPLTKEDILKGLDGEAEVSLYEMLLVISDPWVITSLTADPGYISRSYSVVVGEQYSLKYVITQQRPPYAGLPSRHKLIMRIPDRTCGGEYEYEFWGTTNPKMAGCKLFNGYRVPDFGYPHPFALKAHEQGWGWNNFYYDRLKDSSKKFTLLNGEKTGEIWRALMLLLTSHYESFRNDAEFKIIQGRTSASLILAEIVDTKNTFWGD
jgi:hypothetical protein